MANLIGTKIKYFLSGGLIGFYGCVRFNREPRTVKLTDNWKYPFGEENKTYHSIYNKEYPLFNLYGWVEENTKVRYRYTNFSISKLEIKHQNRDGEITTY